MFQQHSEKGRQCPELWWLSLQHFHSTLRGIISCSSLEYMSCQVSNDPSSHPHLHRFLSQVSGFDCVDDESKHEVFQVFYSFYSKWNWSNCFFILIFSVQSFHSTPFWLQLWWESSLQLLSILFVRKSLHTQFFETVRFISMNLFSFWFTTHH